MTPNKQGMKLENQVISLELAKKLKELGVKQESLFYWQQYYTEMKGGVSASSFKINQQKNESKKGMRCFSAFTVAELGEMLNGQWDRLPTKKSDGIWKAHAPWTPETGEILIQANTEADARAKMLIYLLENKLITP